MLADRGFMSKRYLFLAPAILCIAMLATASGQQPVFPPKVSLDDIRHRVSDSKKIHPRLLATPEQLAGLSRSLDKDPLRKQLADSIIRQADVLCAAEPIERKLQGRRLLSVSRRCVQRVLLL